MIKAVQDGKYRLIETRQAKVLFLDKTAYVWLAIPGIGQILELSRSPHKADHILAQGSYRIYDVEDEPRFSTHKHLELFLGEGQWQGYLILSSSPAGYKSRSRIVATTESIAGLSQLKSQATRT